MKHNPVLALMGVQQWHRRSDNSSLESDHKEGTIEAEQPPVVPTELKSESVLPLVLDGAEVTTTNDTKTITDSRVELPQQAIVVKQPRLDWSGVVAMLNQDKGCRSCSESTPILGDGNQNADWMFIFDSPNPRDIEQQSLLTGREGQLFDAILLALDMERKSVYLSSIFKCPPSADLAAVKAQCDQILQHQVELVQPKVIVALGEFVAQTLIKTNDSLSDLGLQRHYCHNQTIPVISTHSLAQMLDEPLRKVQVWNALKHALKILKS